MTDVELPQMAGSGDSDPGAEHRSVENSEINSNKETSETVNNVKRHKRAHSRNKSISGRQDFLEEIANSEFKQTEAADTNDGCDMKDEEEGFKIEFSCARVPERNIDIRLCVAFGLKVPCLYLRALAGKC